MKTPTPTMELAEFPRQMSLSTFLSPKGALLTSAVVPTVFTLAGKPLDSLHLVLLALNEECRGIARGALYHLPLRTGEHEAHPCDLVYLPDEWNKYDKVSWDKASWAERLEMCKMEDRIDVDEDVLPICARILRFGEDDTPTYGRERSDSGYGSRTDSSFCPDDGPVFTTTGLMTSPISNPSSRGPTIQYDPAFTPDAYMYSRPMEDISSYLILYTSHHSTPIFCATAAFEHSSLAERYPTHGDFSETFHFGPENLKQVQGLIDATIKMKCERNKQMNAEHARMEVMSSGLSSNRELVERMWTIWHLDYRKMAELEKSWVGRIKYSWQEIKSIVDNGRIGSPGLPSGWPVGEQRCEANVISGIEHCNY